MLKKSFLSKYLGISLLLSMIIIAFFNFDNYGISWDEPTQRATGIVNYEYIFSDKQDLLNYHDKDYGAAFELSLIIIEKALNLTSIREIYLMRHFFSHLFFLVGAFFCFKLIDFLYKDKILALIGFLFVVLHPLLYAHSFFNSKDVPFMSMFFICFYLSAKAFDRKKSIYFILLGISLGLLINIRIMGVLLLVAVLPFLLIDAIKERKFLLHLKFLGYLLTFSLLVLIATWPYLWVDPVDNFMIAFDNMSHFRWEGQMLFMGEMISSLELPWYYIPIWFSISTPIFYLIAGVLGIGFLLFHIIQKPLHFIFNSMQRNNLLYMVCFIVPLIVVIYLGSVMYDSWRQMYFIYAGFVMLAVYGIHYFFSKISRKIIIGIATVAFSFVAVFMIVNHPFQQVYFNLFANPFKEEHIRHNFEMDYWGSSYRQALEYILENDSSEVLKIALAIEAHAYNAYILPAEEGKRIHIVPLDEAEYFISNFRFHPSDYTELKEYQYHKIRVGNNTICELFKLK